MTGTSKWRKVWILCCVNDDTCMDAAYAYKDWYKVPDNQCFTTFHCNHRGFTLAKKDCLTDATAQDKLIIISHSNEIGIEIEVAFRLADDHKGKGFARRLRSYGLTNIGLITVKSCKFGLGGELEKLLDEFQANGGAVGAIKGYKGYTVTYQLNVPNPHEYKPREVITRSEPKDDPEEFSHAKLATCLGQRGNDSGRYRMVTGTLYKNGVMTDKIQDYASKKEIYDEIYLKESESGSTPPTASTSNSAISSHFTTDATINTSTSSGTDQIDPDQIEPNEPFYIRFLCCFTQCINPSRNKVRPKP